MKEDVCVFGRNGNLVGVLTRPETPSGIGLALLSAGLLSKPGMGRMHVQLARRLAARGVTSLRFDFSSVGDSPARPDDLGVLAIAAEEPSEAIDLLQAEGCTRFVLAGLCSGAVAALLAADKDPRVNSIVALNPPPLSTDRGFERKGLRQRYLKRSITSPRAWMNLLTGRVRLDRIRQAAGVGGGSGAEAPTGTMDATPVLERLATRGVPMTFVLSQHDKAASHTELVLRDLPEPLRNQGTIRATTIAGAAHGFLLQSEKEQVFGIFESVIEAVSVDR